MLRSVGESNEGVLEEERPPQYSDFAEAGRVCTKGLSDASGSGEGKQAETVTVVESKSVRVLGIPMMTSTRTVIRTVMVTGKDGRTWFEDEIISVPESWYEVPEPYEPYVFQLRSENSQC